MALKPLNSVGGFSVGEIPANVILANSDIFSNRFTVNTFANLGNVGNVYIGGGNAGAVLSTDGSGNLIWSSSPGVTEIQNGTSNVNIPLANGNIQINAGNSALWTFDTTGNLTGPAIGTANLGNLVTANFANFTNNIVVQGNIANANNISITNNLDGNTANFSGNLVSLNANLGNLVTANYANFANGVTVVGNLEISNTSSSFGILTDNLYYANGQPWDLQEAAGANTQIQYNDGNNNFGASAAFTFDYAGNVLTVTGNAQFENVDGGNLVKANNFSTNGSGGDITLTGGNIQGANVVISNSFTSNGGVVDFSTNNAIVQLGDVGNVHILGGGSGYVLQTDGAGNLSWSSAPSITEIQNGNSNVTIPIADGNVYVNANSGGVDQQWNFDTTGVLTTPGNIDLAGNSHVMGINDVNGSGIQLYSNNYAQLNYNNSSYVYVESDGVWLDVNAGTLQLDATGNVIISQNLEVQGNIANANNISATNSISAGSANITNDLNVGGNIQTGGGTGGNISGVDYIFAQYANLSSDLNVNNNAYIQGTVTANYFYANYDANIAGNLTVQTNANINGNLTVGNISGVFANGTSNVAIPTVNGNVIISVNGTASVLTVTDTNVVTAGNTVTSGNVISNATFIGNTITSVGTYLTIASDQSANGSYNINLVPGGAGNVDVNSRYITSVADPINPQDAATKQYVDSVSQGLYIHPAANLLSATNLNATYTIGGITLTVTDIIGNNTIQFSTAHGLSVDNDVTFTNSFNGLIGSPDVYYVDTIPAPNQITLKETYFGPIVNNLTPGTGLSEPSIGQAGVGATLTNAGTNAALAVDSITTTVGERILVTGQSDQAQNGIYDVTTVGDGSTPWVLTRSSDGNTYVPQSSTALCSGAYFFIQNGNVYGGSSWVLSTTGEINIGVTNITFTQFSTGGAYTGTSGILVTGTQISANVDNVTTAIVGGNIAIKTGANLTTPNIGDATFSSLTWNTLSNGNINVSNVNASNTVLTNVLSVNTSATVNSFVSNTTANITTDLTVGGNTYLANSTGTQVVVGSGSGGNISGVNYLNANYANIQFDVFASGNANITGNLTANSSFLGETSITGNANISANLISNNFTANYDANIVGNANIGKTLFIGNATSNVNISNGSANLTGNIFAGNASSNVSISNGSANLTGNIFAGNNTSNVSINTGDITLTGNVNANTGNVTTTNANISNSITLGNTQVTWGTVTTIGIVANQTIAQTAITGITGIEFLIKGVDSTGAKYSVATVQAVTDGANVDYSVYGGVNLNGSTGSLAVNIANGNIQLQVTPSSSNSTVWTTQYRLI